MKKILFTLLLTLFFIPRVNAAVIPNDFAFYWYSNSNHDYIGNSYVVGNEKVTIPQNSRISAWWVDFSAENFSFIPGQTYTGYLYFTFNNVDYSWIVGEDIEMSVNCFDSPDHVENCTNYITSYTSAYVSGSNDVVIEFDFIAPELVDYEDIVYISLNNSVSNDYALGYSANGKNIQVNFNKLSYFLSGGSVSPGEDIIIDQNEIIIDQNDKTNQKLDELKDSITSTNGPTNLGALDNSAGWLPSGPVDSILNLPLSLLNSLLTAVSSTCQPLTIIFPFVDFSYELPCLSTIYSKISGLNAIVDLIGYTVGVLILYYYFKHLYKWIDDKITMQNDNDWGGI